MSGVLGSSRDGNPVSWLDPLSVPLEALAAAAAHADGDDVVVVTPETPVFAATVAHFGGDPGEADPIWTFSGLDLPPLTARERVQGLVAALTGGQTIIMERIVDEPDGSDRFPDNPGDFRHIRP